MQSIKCALSIKRKNARAEYSKSKCIRSLIASLM